MGIRVIVDGAILTLALALVAGCSSAPPRPTPAVAKHSNAVACLDYSVAMSDEFQMAKEVKDGSANIPQLRAAITHAAEQVKVATTYSTGAVSVAMEQSSKLLSVYAKQVSEGYSPTGERIPYSITAVEDECSNAGDPIDVAGD